MLIFLFKTCDNNVFFCLHFNGKHSGSVSKSAIILVENLMVSKCVKIGR